MPNTAHDLKLTHYARRRGSGWTFVFSLIWCGVIAVLGLFWLLSHSANLFWAAGVLVLVFFVFIGGYMCYSAFTGLVNRTIITVESGNLVVRERPFPWRRSARVAVGDIRRLATVRSVRKVRGGRKLKSFRLDAELRDGSVLPLATYDLDEAVVAEIARRITEHLGLGDGAGHFADTAVAESARPPAIQMRERDGVLYLTYRPRRFGFVVLFMFALVWCSGLLAFTIEAPWFMLPFVFPLWLVGPAFLYYALVGLVNRKQVAVSRAELAVSSGPLPWFGNVKLESSTIEQLFVKRQKNKSKGQTTYTFVLCARLSEGRELELGGALEEVGEARFLEQQVEDRLGIANVAVPGEFR